MTCFGEIVRSEIRFFFGGVGVGGGGWGVGYRFLVLIGSGRLRAIMLSDAGVGIYAS